MFYGPEVGYEAGDGNSSFRNTETGAAIRRFAPLVDGKFFSLNNRRLYCLKQAPTFTFRFATCTADQIDPPAIEAVDLVLLCDPNPWVIPFVALVGPLAPLEMRGVHVVPDPASPTPPSPFPHNTTLSWILGVCMCLPSMDLLATSYKEKIGKTLPGSDFPVAILASGFDTFRYLPMRKSDNENKAKIKQMLED